MTLLLARSRPLGHRRVRRELQDCAVAEALVLAFRAPRSELHPGTFAYELLLALTTVPPAADPDDDTLYLPQHLRRELYRLAGEKRPKR